MEVRTLKTNKFTKEAGEKLTEIARTFENKEILLLLAGGSSMGMLEFVRKEVLGPHVTMTMLDERFSTDPKICNFLQLKVLPFYGRAVEADVNIFDTSQLKGETVEELSGRWETALRDWTSENPKGAVISTFGIGEDGHICGIMPRPDDPPGFSEMFENDGRQVVGYDAGPQIQYPLRVTTTFSFLRKYLTAGVVYVSGEKKRAALNFLLSGDGKLYETPARILRELPNITLFTDIEIIMKLKG